MIEPSFRWAFGLLGFSFGGLLWLDAANDTLRADTITTTIAFVFVAFIGYFAVNVAVERGHVTNWTWLLLVGLGLRLALVFTEPTLSDDVYRYLWEGHLVTEGVSPYGFAIDSPEALTYDTDVRSMVNNQTLASPYLPFAHLIFGAAALVLPAEPWSMQLVMIAFDVLAAAMVIKLLRLVRLPERRVLLYWLNPLVIIEVAHGAHLDAIIFGLASVGLYWTLDRASASPVTRYGAPIVLAAATLTRPIAALLVVVLFWLWSARQRITYAVAVALPVLVTGAFSGFGLDDSGTGVFGSARAYSETFRFNSAIYQRLERWIGGRGFDDKGLSEPVGLTRLIVAATVALLLLAVFVIARREREPRATLRLLVVPVVIYVLFTPVLHPWYTLLLLGLVPFLAPSAGEQAAQWLDVAPWIVLSVLLILSYLTYEDPQAFAERAWVPRLEWDVTIGLLLVALVAKARYATRLNRST